MPSRQPPQRLPKAVAGELGLVIVDATWGTIQPLQLPGGVQTVGELEVIGEAVLVADDADRANDGDWSAPRYPGTFVL